MLLARTGFGFLVQHGGEKWSRVCCLSCCFFYPYQSPYYIGGPPLLAQL